MMDSPDSRSRDLKIAQLIERGFSTHPLVVPPIGTPSTPTQPTRPDAFPQNSAPGTPKSSQDGPSIHFTVP